MAQYHDFHVPEEIPEPSAEPDEELFFDFGDDEIRALPQEVLESE